MSKEGVAVYTFTSFKNCFSPLRLQRDRGPQTKTTYNLNDYMIFITYWAVHVAYHTTSQPNR